MDGHFFGQTPKNGIPSDLRALWRYTRIHFGINALSATLIGQLNPVPHFGGGGGDTSDIGFSGWLSPLLDVTHTAFWCHRPGPFAPAVLPHQPDPTCDLDIKHV